MPRTRARTTFFNSDSHAHTPRDLRFARGSLILSQRAPEVPFGTRQLSAANGVLARRSVLQV
jgi:hypothetical protein